MLETLVALTIFAVTLSALLAAYSNGLAASRTSERHALAHVLAQSLLAEAKVDAARPPSSATGRSAGFSWRVTSRPLPTSVSATQVDREWRLYEIDVRISWDTARSFSLKSLKLARASP